MASVEIPRLNSAFNYVYHPWHNDHAQFKGGRFALRISRLKAEDRHRFDGLLKR
jgi:hypothetical protein